MNRTAESTLHIDGEFRFYAWTLFLMFLGLRLCGVIAWPWWQVLAPAWIPMACRFAVGFAAGVAAAIGNR